jgi:hypothetical protein
VLRAWPRVQLALKPVRASPLPAASAQGQQRPSAQASPQETLPALRLPASPVLQLRASRAQQLPASPVRPVSQAPQAQQLRASRVLRAPREPSGLQGLRASREPASSARAFAQARASRS